MLKYPIVSHVYMPPLHNNHTLPVLSSPAVLWSQYTFSFSILLFTETFPLDIDIARAEITSF